MRRLVLGICDDEEVFRNEIKRAIEIYARDRELDVSIILFTDGEELLRFGETLDILFLDEEMSNISGTEVKSHLTKMKSKTAIIYVTSHDEIMSKAFGRNVYGFITKPIDYKAFYDIIDSVIEQLDNSNDIMYIEAESQYIRYHFVSGKSLLEKHSLLDVLEKLNNSNFVRCHRSWVINLIYIDKIENSFSEIVMSDGKRIPVSRKQRSDFKHAYAGFIDMRMQIMMGD